MTTLTRTTTKVTHTFVGGGWKAEPGSTPTSGGRNYLIVCAYGDWSGFRTLDACLRQNPDPNGLRPDGFYWIEVR